MLVWFVICSSTGKHCAKFPAPQKEEARLFFSRAAHRWFNTICRTICSILSLHPRLRECQFRYLPAFARTRILFAAQMLPASVKIAASKHRLPHFAVLYIFVIYSLRWRDAEASAKVPLWIRRFVYLQPLLPSAETIWKVLRFVDQNKWSISYWAAPLAMLDFASIEEAVAGEKETERALAGNFPFPNSQWWKCKYSKSKTTGESVKWWIQFVGA